MKEHNHENARRKILELCSEDYYGVWELYGTVALLLEESEENKNSAVIFIQLVKDLIDQGAIIAKKQNRLKDELEAVVLDEVEFVRQLESAASPDPESFYWFGLK